MHQLMKPVVLLGGSLALWGCGNSGPQAPKAAAPPTEHGIFISSADCAASGKLTIDECGQAIDLAVSQHETTAPKFDVQSQCEDKFGVGRCEKGMDARFRARLQAFFVTLEKPGHAVGLYPPAKSMIGFVSPSQQLVDARDPTLKVSNGALSLAHENASFASSEPDHPQALGAAAANIH